MKKSSEIRQLMSQKIEAQNSLVAKAETEKRDFSNDETTQFRSLQTEIDALKDQLRDAEAFEANQRMLAGNNGVPQKETPEERELQKMKRNYSIHKVIRSVNGTEILDGVEKEIHDETVKRAKDTSPNIVFSGVAVPMDFGKRNQPVEKRADGQTVTQDSGGFGGNLVQTDVQSPIEFLRPRPILEDLGATVLTGLTGNLKFPVNNGGVVATWEGEVDTVANTKNAIGSKNMIPKRLAASVLISLQNLMQSAFDLELMTVQEINRAIAVAMDLAGINGAGTGNVPKGILNDADANQVVMGTNGGSLSWASLIALETAVYQANAALNPATMAYLINPGTRGRAKVVKQDANDSGYLMVGNEINGYRVGVSTHVPNNLTKGTASGVCNAGIFGDFSQLLIGQWAFMDLSIDNTSRKKEGYIEITANTFVDMLLRQPKAFSVVKDWLLS